MRGYMFRNRWFALLFVGLVLAAVTRIVGTGNGDGALEDATRQIAAQQDRAEQLTGDTLSEPAVDAALVEFTPDEELIDPATGEDPTPIDEFVEQAEPAEEAGTEVIIVSQDSAEAVPAQQAY